MLDFLLFDDAKLNITRCTSKKKHFARLAKLKLTYIFSYDITAFQNVKKDKVQRANLAYEFSMENLERIREEAEYCESRLHVEV